MADVKIKSDEFTALLKLMEAWTKLKTLGWTEPRYFQFPPEGQTFELIELGSTGIHRAVKSHGYFFVDGEWPSQPFLVRKVELGDVKAK